MLTNLLSGLYDVIKFLFDLNPLNIELPTLSNVGAIAQIINLMNFILPMDTIGMLFILTFALTGVRLFIAIVKSFADLKNIFF